MLGCYSALYFNCISFYNPPLSYFYCGVAKSLSSLFNGFSQCTDKHKLFEKPASCCNFKGFLQKGDKHLKYYMLGY